MKYSFWKGVWKTVSSLVIFAGPLAITTLETMPETSTYLDMTLSSVLYMVINYLKVRSK